MEIFKIRWLYASCYEIILANGKAITFDPYVSPLNFPNFGVDDMKTPDYLFCTHTHFDHIMDIGTLMNRNLDAILFVGILGAVPLADYYDLHLGQVNAIRAFQTVVYDDIKVTAYPGKHTRFKAREIEIMSTMAKAPAGLHGAKGMEHLMSVGSVEYTDFLITLPGNFRILFAGGDKNYIAQHEAAAKEAPDLVIRQTANIGSPEEYAELAAKYGAQYILPHHHENTGRKLGIGMDEFTNRVNQKLEQIAPGMRFINPEQFKWYGFSSTLTQL
jgi:L-ascorbate metabolism protein UlaG (beta-lactamase superfamily)